MKKNHITFLLFALLSLLCGAAHAKVINNQALGINATVYARYVTPDGNHMYLATSEGVKIGIRSPKRDWSWKTVTKDQGLPGNNIDDLAVATDKNGNATALFVASANIKSGKGGISKIKLDGSGVYWTVDVNCTCKSGDFTLSLTQNSAGLPVVLFAKTGKGLMKLSNLAQDYIPATIQWLDPKLANYSVLVTYKHSTGELVKLYALKKINDNLLYLYDINTVSPSKKKLITITNTQDIGSDFVNFFHSLISEMFKLNKECQEQNYYMGEFEFKLLGAVYWLDHVQHVKAVTKTYQYYRQLKTTKGLVKVPDFKNKQEELEFYLSLQNPKTGAFMDDTYPFCEYTGPTSNVLPLLDELATATGQQLKLKYPLKYLDQVNTPKKMKSYLDDVAIVGWIQLKFPQTTFHQARDMLSIFYEEVDVIDKYGLYKMPSETKKAILAWFYANQDPSTGLWGPKNKKGKLVKKDTQNSASIVKSFVDENGHDKFKDFPLKYRDKLAGSFLNAVSNLLDNIPGDQDLDQWHEWNLNIAKSMKTLTKYLWTGLSEESRQKTKAIIEKYIRLKFQKFYIKAEGAFSYYPGSEHATLDGSGFIGNLWDYGYCSAKNQIKLWKPGIEKKEYNISNFTKADFHMDLEGINSIRFYAVDPQAENCIDNYIHNVLGVFYPRKTNILDAMELIPRMQNWLNNTKQTMGNWTSKAEIQRMVKATGIKSTPVLKQNLPVEELNDVLQKNNKLILVGFDILQIPRVEAVYNYKRL
ncbi:MAG: hypothetical protein PVG30_03645 [Gammaproteobacteria bacterium]|jgi:hypothetical protein